jgi:DNA-binding transcriptional ArsR family regulator
MSKSAAGKTEAAGADSGDPARNGLAGYRALAHPMRLRMVRLLREEPMSASGLARVLDIRPGSARFHLGVLARAGIAHLVQERRRRGGRELLYAAEDTIRLPADVGPNVRGPADRAFVAELGRLLDEALGNVPQAETESDTFSMHELQVRPEELHRAEAIVAQANKAFRALHRPKDPDARPVVTTMVFFRAADAAASRPSRADP